MERNDLEERLNGYLAQFNVMVRFSKKAFEDISSYKQETQEIIIALILKRAHKGPLIRPKGIGKSLERELHGYCKIKPKYLNLRIIYKPVEDNIIRMEIIAIGPRDKEKVYKMAARRVLEIEKERE